MIRRLHTKLLMKKRTQLIEGILEDIHTMKHNLMVEHIAKDESSITPSQALVLRYIAKHDASNVKSIAQALHITSSAATQLIDGLVSNKFLVRKSDSNDRRIVKLSLSKKSIKLIAAYKEKGLKKVVSLFDALNNTELVQYASLNKKVAASISQTNKH